MPVEYDQEMRDLCAAMGDDVMSAIKQRMSLVSDPRQKSMIATAALSTAASAAAGAMVASTGGALSDHDPMDVAVEILRVIQRTNAN